MSRNPLTTKKFMNNVLSRIETFTGVGYAFNMKDEDTLVYDLDLGNSYITNNGGKGLFFALVNLNGNTCCEISNQDADCFVTSVVNIIIKCRRECKKCSM